MSLKRKRSSDGFSSPASDISTSTTLSNYYNFSKPVDALPVKSLWQSNGKDYSSLRPFISGRTQKRYRDNRPEAEQIYANTIARLYNAQRERPNAEPLVPQPTASQEQRPLQKTSLHSFWNISQPPPQQLSISQPALHDTTPKCEDCERPLQSEDAMEIDGDMLLEATRCHSCSRQVCDTCAISGDRRICLDCAARDPT